jgi:hypothetical protein
MPCQAKRYGNLGDQRWKRILASHRRILDAIRMAGRAAHRFLQSDGSGGIGVETFFSPLEDRFRDAHMKAGLGMSRKPISLEAPFVLDPGFIVLALQDCLQGFGVGQFVKGGNVDALAGMARVMFRARLGWGGRRHTRGSMITWEAAVPVADSEAATVAEVARVSPAATVAARQGVEPVWAAAAARPGAGVLAGAAAEANQEVESELVVATVAGAAGALWAVAVAANSGAATAAAAAVELAEATAEAEVIAQADVVRTPRKSQAGSLDVPPEE